MDDAQLDDLKQFILATVSQSEARIRKDLGQDIDNVKQGLGGVRQELKDVR